MSEIEELRAEVERLVRHSPEHEARAVMVQTLYDLRDRAEAAEAELADARERLRLCEERLADVEALAATDGAWKGKKHLRITQCFGPGVTKTVSAILVSDLRAALDGNDD